MTEKDDVKLLYERFHAAFKALRQAWLKTGGGMDMQLRIRDPDAQTRHLKRRREAARKKS